MAKSRYAEIICRVRIPRGATLAQVRYAVTEQWPDYVAVYMDGYMEPNRLGNCPTLKPRWVRARLARAR